MKNNLLIKSAITSILALTTAASMTSSANAAEQKMEKCYGIVKAGLNDCAAGKSSCAGSATVDKQPDAFIFLPKGSCNKIVGGSLTPNDKQK